MRIYAKIFCKGYDYRSNYLKKNTKGIIPQVAQHLQHLIRIFPGNPTVAQHAMVTWCHGDIPVKRPARAGVLLGAEV